MRVLRPGGASLRWQLIMLVVISVLLSTLAFIALTRLGPPPKPAPLPLGAIAEMLRSGRTDITSELRVTLHQSAAAPTAPPGLHAEPAQLQVLARLLQCPPQALRFYRDRDTVPALAPPPGAPPGASPVPDVVVGQWLAALQQGDHWRIVHRQPQAFWTPWLRSLLLLSAVSLCLVLLPTIALASRIAQPLQRLAEHARGPWRADLFTDAASLPREIKILAEALSAMQRRLEQNVEERTRMLVAIAHDLRTPLTRLAFRLESLGPASRDKAAADLAEMRAMIESLLEFVRGNGRQLALERLDLSALLSTVCDGYLDTGASLALQMPERIIVQADATALRRLFLNLIDNALRYAGQIEIEAWQSGEAVRIEFRDRGPGVPEAALERIFDPFFRVDEARGRSEGNLGLGLANARLIARKHGGELSARNRPDGGLCLTLSLPRQALPLPGFGQ
ncbi:Signal transduction histidine kinase [Solimonas aquatica]|uniref:histidine kinase n=1 Tax=Solimonas aquatica TaxID=489703 RepID=A0A1H9GGU0_9GAMM|nr:HAMP domain-containing sensor histidine kinase [Solimonas aquatica]SEQ49311.1 Signal transduction histidine kinase [Solimonas aquatica]